MVPTYDVPAPREASVAALNRLVQELNKQIAALQRQVTALTARVVALGGVIVLALLWSHPVHAASLYVSNPDNKPRSHLLVARSSTGPSSTPSATPTITPTPTPPSCYASIVIAAAADDIVARGNGSASYPPAFTACDSTGNLFTRKQFSSPNYDVRNMLFAFTVPGIAVGDVITSASLNVYAINKADANARSLVCDWFNWGGTCGSGDYSASVGTDALAGVALSSITTGAVNRFELLDPNTNINRAGVTYIRCGISGGAPAGDNTVTFAPQGGANPTARLNVVFGAASTGSATDTFERAALGVNWQVFNGAVGIVSSSDWGLTSNSGGVLNGLGISSWCENTFGLDQYSQAEYSSRGVGGTDKADGQVYVRRRSDQARYGCMYDPDVAQWVLKLDGLDTGTIDLATTGVPAAPVTGDVVRVEARGSAVRCLKNGVEILSATNSVITQAGQTGLVARIINVTTFPVNVWEVWTGGALPTLTPTP